MSRGKKRVSIMVNYKEQVICFEEYFLSMLRLADNVLFLCIYLLDRDY